MITLHMTTDGSDGFFRGGFMKKYLHELLSTISDACYGDWRWHLPQQEQNDDYYEISSFQHTSMTISEFQTLFQYLF